MLTEGCPALLGGPGWPAPSLVVSLSPENKSVYLPRVARGVFLTALALPEPDTGSDLASMQCTAVREGDEWVISGKKCWCTFANGADYLTLLARTQAQPSAKKRSEIPRRIIANDLLGKSELEAILKERAFGSER